MSNKYDAAYWIDKLQLTQHIEGGSYRRIYSADLIIAHHQLPEQFKGNRPVCSAIYFLLQENQFSAMHRIASDEIWHFYYGDPLTVYEIEPTGLLHEHLLGNNPENGEAFQCVVKAGSWFGSKTNNNGLYSLVGCTVSPGFDFDDFELANRQSLLQLFPQHAAVINNLTK